MLLQLLGLFDLIGGISLFLLRFHLFPGLAFWFGAYFILKGLLFIRTPVSIMDLLCGVVFFVAGWWGYSGFMLLFSLWLLQKGAFSFFQ